MTPRVPGRTRDGQARRKDPKAAFTLTLTQSKPTTLPLHSPKRQARAGRLGDCRTPISRVEKANRREMMLLYYGSTFRKSWCLCTRRADR